MALTLFQAPGGKLHALDCPNLEVRHLDPQKLGWRRVDASTIKTDRDRDKVCRYCRSKLRAQVAPAPLETRQPRPVAPERAFQRKVEHLDLVLSLAQKHGPWVLETGRKTRLRIEDFRAERRLRKAAIEAAIAANASRPKIPEGPHTELDETEIVDAEVVPEDEPPAT